MTALTIRQAGPMTSVQDAPRQGVRRLGLSASGPMDQAGFALAGALAGAAEHSGGIEVSAGGLAFSIDCEARMGCAGGAFVLAVNGEARPWPGSVVLSAGDMIEIHPGRAGNWGYLRFSRPLALPPVLGSLSTHVAVGIGGLDGRCLREGDMLPLGPEEGEAPPAQAAQAPADDMPFRVIWGLHADTLPRAVRRRFVEGAFTVSSRMDRMGMRLVAPDGLFSELDALNLVSDAVVPGDIQILGDGAPIVLMRDFQPTGGYPRIATLIAADLDRFAQQRPGASVRFTPVTVAHAQALDKAAQP